MPRGSLLVSELHTSPCGPGKIGQPVSPGFLGTQQSQFLDIQVVLEAFMAKVSLKFWKPLADRGPGGLIPSYIWKERQEGQR